MSYAINNTINTLSAISNKFKVNLHLLENCNYSCHHCFAHFSAKKVLDFSVWKKIIDNCIVNSHIADFNLAGGEPLMHKNFSQILQYIYNSGSSTSVITNGFLINSEWIRTNIPFISTIGISVDSFNHDTLIKMGRCTRGGKYLSKENLEKLCFEIKSINPNCQIKFNTVVSSLNMNEIMSTTINNLPISRWKVLRIQPFDDSLFNNKDILISKKEYISFIKNNFSSIETIENLHKYLNQNEDDNQGYANNNTLSFKLHLVNGCEAIIEESLRGGYIMIDANGHLVDDTQNDSYTSIIDCKTETFDKGLELLNFNENLYSSRYSENVPEIQGKSYESIPFVYNV